MKKLIFALSAIFLCNPYLSIGLTNSKTKTSVTFCAKKTKEFLNYSDLLKCNELVPSSKTQRITSFKVSYIAPDSTGEEGKGMLHEFSIKGNKLDQETIEVFKTFESTKVKKIYFEDILIADEKGEKKAAPIIINLR